MRNDVRFLKSDTTSTNYAGSSFLSGRELVGGMAISETWSQVREDSPPYGEKRP